ncbi:hypothetical protein K3495_g4781 [Podosphaera aphanis]|nr:hypothetical protein K3495_g4781 [Podosphaera aphanis]
MAGPSSSFANRYILSDDNSWANWFEQIKQQAITYQLVDILNPINPELQLLKFPGIPNYPDIIDDVDYLTLVLINTTIENTTTPPPEPVYELTVLNRARFNRDKARNVAERDLVGQKRANYTRLRSFIFKTIDKSNKDHLHACIIDAEYSEVGGLIHILKTHRQQSESSVRT